MVLSEKAERGRNFWPGARVRLSPLWDGQASFCRLTDKGNALNFVERALERPRRQNAIDHRTSSHFSPALTADGSVRTCQSQAGEASSSLWEGLVRFCFEMSRFRFPECDPNGTL